MPKPPLGKVAVGDQLTVIPASYSNRVNQKATEATVTKIGRVWVDLAEVDGPRTWRLRLDTQMNSGNGTYRDRFLSREQYDWEQTIAAARAVLREAKVLTDHGTRWNDDEARLLALATFVRAYDKQHPA